MPDRRAHDRSQPPSRSGGPDFAASGDPFDDPFDDDVGGADPDPAEVLARLRPPPPRTWRDRVDEVLADPPPLGRVAVVVVGLVVAALVGWRLLTPSPTAPEDGLPVAQPTADETPAAASEPGPPSAVPAGGADAVPGAAPSEGAAGVAGAPGGEVVVHVVGAVATPGVRRLPVGSRVVDAIDASGGAGPDADLARVNLAAVLVDGQQVVVPRPGEVVAPVDAAAPAGGGAAGGDGSATGAPIDINTASAAELEELPGVGPATAEAIVAHRESSGPFTSVDDLLDVRGIGDVKLEQIRDRATV